MRTRKWRSRALAVLLAPVLTTTFLSLVPAPASAVSLANGGFETGDFTSWSLPRTNPAAIIDTQIVKSGTYSAYLGAGLPESPPGDSQIMQTVAVPAVGTTMLDLDWYPYSYEYAMEGGVEGCMLYDWQDVIVYDEAMTTPLSWLMHTCSNAQEWQHLSFDLTPWAGTTISLVFSDRQDYSFVTSMRLDNIAVTTTTGYDTSVTDISNPDAYTCPVPSSTMIGFEDRQPWDLLDGLEISGVTFESGAVWRVWFEQEGWAAAGSNYAAVTNGSGRMTFAQPVADVSMLATIGESPVYLQAYSATDTLLATAGPAAVNYGTGHMTELRVTSQAEDIAYVVVHDSANYFAIDDVCYAGLTAADVATTTTLASNHSPSVFGQSVELTATVTPASGSDVPTGTVEFWEGTTKLGEDAVNGSGHATLTVSDFAVGSHSVTAKYLPTSGNGFTGSESDPLEQVVHKADTTTTINSVTPAHPTYGQTLSFSTTVAPVAPGDGLPTGDVTYVVNKFGNTDVPNVGWEAYDPATDVLPAGTHNVEAIYPGDDHFKGSRSDTFVVTIDKATSTVTYLGDYLAITGVDFTLKANVDSAVAACKADRDVTFTLDDGQGGLAPIVITGAKSGAGGAVTKTVPTASWSTGEYDVLVQVAESDNCTAASNATAMDLVTVAAPGDAATGGGWYFYKDSGAGKRVNFGFTVSKQTDNTYKGSLLLVNQAVWRLKGSLDSFTRTDQAGQAGGTGTLYQWVLANQGDPTSGYWANPRTVSFKIAFTDEAAGKAKGKKSVVVDQFALSQISYRSTNPPLPTSALMGLKGGNIVLR